MVRKCANFAFGLAFVVALGLTTTHTHPLKTPGGPTGFSIPYEPALPAFQAANESHVVSTVDSIFAAENAGVPAGVARASRVEGVLGPILSAVAAVYPPLFHRPPPSNS